MSSEQMLRKWLHSALKDEFIKAKFDNLIQTTKENDNAPSSDVVMSMLADAVDRAMRKRRNALSPRAEEKAPSVDVTPSANTNISNNTERRYTLMNDDTVYAPDETTGPISPDDQHYGEKEDLIVQLCSKLGIPASNEVRTDTTDDHYEDCVSNLRTTPNVTGTYERDCPLSLNPKLETPEQSYQLPDDDADFQPMFSIRALRESLAKDKVSTVEDAGECSSDDEFLSVADTIQEEPSMMLESLNDDQHLADDEYESGSDNDDVKTKDVKPPRRSFTRPPKTIRPQFLGSLFVKKLAHARETAAEVAARKPEPRVKNDKPVKLDTNLMYAVRRSLKRSLPGIAATSNLSALMMMAEGMYDEMSLDRELDDLAWPFDPLKECMESGLALVDYMDPLPTFPSIKSGTTATAVSPRSAAPEKVSASLSSFPKISVTELSLKPSVSLKLLSPFTNYFNRGSKTGPSLTTSYLGKYLRSVFSLPSVSVPEITLLPESDAQTPLMITESSGPQKDREKTKRGVNGTDDSRVSAESSTAVSEEQVVAIKPPRSANGKTFRPQFVGKNYMKSIQKARQYAAEIESKVSYPKSLKDRSISGRNNSPVFNLMAERVCSRASFEDVTWPIDPLDDLKKSGLWMIDYMDSSNTDDSSPLPPEEDSQITEITDECEEFYDADDTVIDAGVLEADFEEDDELHNGDRAPLAGSNASIRSSVSEELFPSDPIRGEEETLANDVSTSFDSFLGKIEKEEATPPNVTPEESNEFLGENWESRVITFQQALNKGEDDNCSEDSALGRDNSNSTLTDEGNDPQTDDKCSSGQNIHDCHEIETNGSATDMSQDSPTSPSSPFGDIEEVILSSRIDLYERLAMENRLGKDHISPVIKKDYSSRRRSSEVRRTTAMFEQLRMDIDVGADGKRMEKRQLHDEGETAVVRERVDMYESFSATNQENDNEISVQDNEKPSHIIM